MGLIDRFTRDTASKYVWAVLALVAAGGLVFAITNGARALDDERADAQARAVLYVEEALVPRIAGEALVAPITGPQAASLDAAIQRTVLVDDRLSRVRIWSADGRLLFSTDGADALGSNAGLNDPLLREASRDGVLTRSNVSDTGGQNDPERSLLRTYVPVGARAVVEIDQTDEATLAAVRTEWWYYQLLAGAMLLLLLVMTGLSLRDPIEPINVGVPFAASSIPAGFSLIDNERLHAVEEVYRLASERVGRLQEKLDESEAARRGLEGDIQRALSKVGRLVPARRGRAADPSARGSAHPSSRGRAGASARGCAAAGRAGPGVRRGAHTVGGCLDRGTGGSSRSRLSGPEAAARDRAQSQAGDPEAEEDVQAPESEEGAARRTSSGSRVAAARQDSRATPGRGGGRRSGGTPTGRRRSGDGGRQSARGRAGDVHPPHRERPTAARRELRGPGSGSGRAGAHGGPEEAGRRASPTARGPAPGVAQRPTSGPRLSEARSRSTIGA